jgi:heme-degrading monooxygenase HmoA
LFASPVDRGLKMKTQWFRQEWMTPTLPGLLTFFFMRHKKVQFHTNFFIYKLWVLMSTFQPWFQSMSFITIHISTQRNIVEMCNSINEDFCYRLVTNVVHCLQEVKKLKSRNNKHISTD